MEKQGIKNLELDTYQQVEFNRKKNVQQDQKLSTLSSQVNQLLNQAPAGFLPRVFYGISRGPETYRFIQDTVFTINNLTGNVGDAYELLSPSETGSYIEAIATQINSNQIKITIQGDYQFNTENFTLINLRNGVAVIANLPNSLVLQEASFLGSYNPQDNKEKQITVLYDLESGNDNVVFASVDYNSDDVYNWVRIGGYINGLNGYSIWAVTASTIEAVLASAKDNDILVAGESFNYEDTDFMTGDVDLIVTLEPFVITNRGNIKGETGAIGETGPQGTPGVNGQTPYIQENYWYIGGVNTGVKAVGTDGANGQDGQSFQIQSGLYSVPSNVGQPGNVDYDGNTLSVLPTLPDSTVSGKGYVVYDPLTTPLEPFYDLYYANAGDASWTIIHPFSGIKGQDGRNGYTPYIQNGSWYINGVNQGVPATGPQGAQGEGIMTIENTGYTQGQGFTTTHITATLTDGTEEHFDVTATDGATGATGAPGPTGATPNISVTATALPISSAPTATRSGSNENPIINFGIPSADLQSLVNLFYPVGTVYMTTVRPDNFNPNTAWGGSWELVESGRTFWTEETNGLAGRYIAAGLPNITGTFKSDGIRTTSAPTSGAFSNSQGSESFGAYNPGADLCENYWSFDASNSNSIYGSSNTVQPPAFTVFAWKRNS